MGRLLATATPLLSLLLLAATAMGVAASPRKGDPCGTALRAAMEDAGAGRFGAAAARLSAVSGLCPEDYSVHLMLGYYQLRGNDFAAAEAAYRAAVAISRGSFDARLGLADALAGRGEDASAGELYRVLTAERPGATGARLRWAYNRFLLGDARAARAEYAAVHARAPDNVDALLGLGFCALREGRRAEARAWFRRAAARAPTDERAQEGLDAARVLTNVFPWFVAAGAVYHGHPWREWYGAGALGVRLGFEEWIGLAATYRYLHVGGQETTSGAAPGAVWSGLSRRERLAVSQHEFHLAAGPDGPVWSLLGHGAYLFYKPHREGGAGRAAHAGMAALSTRYRYWADFQMSGGWSFHDDFDVAQIRGGIRLPLLSWFDLVGAFEGQVADGRFWPSGSAEIGLHGVAWALAIGGHMGTRCRPVDLSRSVIYNTADRPSGSAWVRLSADVGRTFVLLASYEFERLLTPAGDGGGGHQEGYVHGLVLGFGVRAR